MTLKARYYIKFIPGGLLSGGVEKKIAAAVKPVKTESAGERKERRKREKEGKRERKERRREKKVGKEERREKKRLKRLVEKEMKALAA